MYGKVFASIYDGSLYGNWEAIVTFQQMIVLCGPDGVIDMTPQSLAARTSIPLDVIEKGIKTLEAPDPYSRTPDHEGRRLERLDSHRPWGWRIVNHAYYRMLAEPEEVRRQNAQRQRRKRERDNNGQAVTSRDNCDSHDKSRQAEAEAEAEAESKTSSSPAVGGDAAERPVKAIPPCPYDAIVQAYHEALPALPRVIALSDTRKGYVNGRWRQVCSEDKLDQKQGVKFFADYFARVSRSKFLTGRSSATPGREKAFRADFVWLVRPENFLKVLEGKYDDSGRRQ